MNKRILLIAAAVLLAILLAVALLPSNSTQTDDPTITQPPDTKPPVTQTQPTTSLVPTTDGTTIITQPTTLPPEPGVVRLYTCDAEQYDAYVTLATEYFDQTGTEVMVFIPSEGETCEEALTRLLASGEPPTIFCIHSQQTFEILKDRLYDLTGSDVANKLYSADLALADGEKTLALAADVAGSGLIFNAALLAQRVGFTQSDIHTFADMQYIFDYITANRKYLNVYTLAAPDYMDDGLMQTLAGLYDDPAQLRSFVELYIRNTTNRNTTLKYFLAGTTVFYIGTTDDYDAVAALGSHNLGFLPAYAVGSDAVQCVCSHYWAVNAAGYQADVQVSLDFMAWLVTAGENGTPVDRLALLAPYGDATYSANTLQKQLRSFLESGNARLSWTVGGKVADVDAFALALRAYVADPSDDTWAAVSALFG